MVFVFLSLLIAIIRVTFSVNLMSIWWGAAAGSLIAFYLSGLFWKRADLAGAMASMISGLGFAVILSLVFRFTLPGIPLIRLFFMLLP